MFLFRIIISKKLKKPLPSIITSLRVSSSKGQYRASRNPITFLPPLHCVGMQISLQFFTQVPLKTFHPLLNHILTKYFKASVTESWRNAKATSSSNAVGAILIASVIIVIKGSCLTYRNSTVNLGQTNIYCMNSAFEF